MDLYTALIFLPGLVVAITLHEFAHAWCASLLGDDFPRRQGRVSLNPLRHLAPLGTLAIFLLPFGWGRPVRLNLYNFKRPKRDYLIVSVAGPFANLVAAAVFLGLMQFTRHCYLFGRAGETPMIWAHRLLMGIAFINMVLATINLIPLPPLDGSKIWPVLIPGLKPSFGRKTTLLFVVVLVMLASTKSLYPLVDFVLSRVQPLVPPSDATVFDDRFDAAESAFLAEQYQQAEQHFTEALRINPRSDESLHWRACARAWQGNWRGALEDMDRAIHFSALTPDYYDFRASVNEALGRTAYAETDRAMARALGGALPPTTQSRPTAS